MKYLYFTVILLLLFSSIAYPDDFIFKPQGCEFEVVFPVKPMISEYYSYDGNRCKTYDAQAYFWNRKGGLRAEGIICQTHNYDNANRENIIELMRDHAKKSGVSDTVFQYSENENFKTGFYRGIIESVANTFVYTVIVGKRSSLTLIGSAPYNLYPLLHYEEFVSSVRQIN